ncbi:MAG: ABC transporter ATP-binding protein [Chloroherpetonaceae bacterium]|nr:ABC transporter ATP-binding protein/permease [Chthonomonadaceae bacterium]MDW8208006.1 ABC transporter ATP-binding protein [Chloroherpetonaceae bacterium]
MSTERRLFAYLKPHIGTLTLGLLCAGAVAAITAGISWLIQRAIDAMVSGEVGHLNFLCGFVLVVFIIKGLFSYGQSYLLSLVANRIGTRLREEIFAHLHTLSLSFFNQRRTGAILSTLTNDVPVVQNAAMSLREIVSAPIIILVSLGALFYVSPRLALASILFIPFMAAVISRIGKRIRTISVRVQGKLADVTTIIEETVAGVRIIKSFGTEHHEVSRFSSENERTLEAILQGAQKSAQLRPMIEFIGAFGIALVLFLGGNYVAHTYRYQARQREAWVASLPEWFARNPGARTLPPEPQYTVPPGGMTQGELIAFLYLLNAVARAAGEIGGIATIRAQALAAARRIFEEVLDIEPDVREKPDAIVLSSISGHIRFENVSFRYHPDAPDVLKDISFEIHPGEVIALVGRSGAGKSTLVDLIPRFYDPTEGRILIDGIDLRDLNLRSLRRQIGIVPQETWLFAGTLRDNIAYGNRDATDEEIRAAAYAANASFIESMPDGLDTVVGERGVRLSGGERQRIAIARAILMNPRLLILDEATSSLDASSEALVQEALDQLMKGRTTIVIAHRLSTIVNADRIFAMKDGRIVETGSHRELMAAGGYYAQLYETQLRGFE